MIDLEVVKAALTAGDVTAVLGIADELCDAGEPEGEEIAGLAVEVMAAKELLVSQAAAACILELLDHVNKREAKKAKEKERGDKEQAERERQKQEEGAGQVRATTDQGGSAVNVDGSQSVPEPVRQQ